MRPCVFLDRDGVINATVWNASEAIFDTPYRIRQFTFVPGVCDAIHRIQDLGYLAVVVSNQPGYAKGKCSRNYLKVVDQLMQRRLARDGLTLDGVYYCHHHPDAVVDELRVVCECRKPRPGMFLQAARELDIDLERSWMIGDQERDVQAGIAAGCRTVLVGGDAPRAGGATPRLETRGVSEMPSTAATLRVRDLSEAVKRIETLDGARVSAVSTAES